MLRKKNQALKLKWEVTMNLSEINWDIHAAGNWAEPVKMAIILFACVAVVSTGVYFDTLDQLKTLDTAEKKELTLKTDFEVKQKKSRQSSGLSGSIKAN